MSVREDMAETFGVVSAIVLVVAVAGVASGTVGRIARPLVVVGALSLVVLGTLVGHSGGQLVYRYGAASALQQAESNSTPAARTSTADP